MRASLRRWRAPLALAALLVILQAAGLRGVLEYRRAAILDGEPWRLLTGSLVHLGWRHLARDLAGLMLIRALFDRCFDELEWLWILACGVVAVGVGLLAFSPGIAWYVGISGALFGLFAAGALDERRTRPVYASLLLLGMVALIAWQWIAGALPGETAGLGGAVVPQAHLYGAIGGATAILLRNARLAWQARRTRPREGGAAASALALCLVLASCVAADSAARIERRPLPVRVESQALAARVSERFLTPHRTALVVHLVARRRIPVVRVGASSPAKALSVPAGCTFRPLPPPHTVTARRPPQPLPVVPLCSLVLEAAESGRYPVDVRIVDGAGRDLVVPIHTLIRIAPKP